MLTVISNKSQLEMVIHKDEGVRAMCVEIQQITEDEEGNVDSDSGKWARSCRATDDDAGQERFTFSQLPMGTYVITVQFEDKKGIKNEQTRRFVTRG